MILLRRFFLALVLLLGASGLGWALTPVGTGSALWLIVSLLQNKEPLPLAPAVTLNRTKWTVDGRTRKGDIWLRQDGWERASLILVPGAAQAGRDDPRLQLMARILAETGFRVIVPELPGMERFQVLPDHARAIADAVRVATDRIDPAARAIGIGAVSYSLVPSIRAALEPDVSADVQAIFALGGFYDSEAVIRFFTTGAYRGRFDETWQFQPPNPRSVWVFLQANLERVVSAQDRGLLGIMATRRLNDPSAALDDLAAGLGPEGQSLYALVRNDDPDAVSDLIAALPAPTRDAITALSLVDLDLSALSARVTLVHSRYDAVIPYTESESLLEALPPGQGHLVLLEDLSHADIGSLSVKDAFSLWGAALSLMQFRQITG
ncbi:alpha/beta hydrolase [Elstera litoralis]|uniref:alpha/beta hydrolase n=1 Tax=Elstera litoralis TaxID=552518 RepID=UPI000698AB5F|nr:alpha/beta hydrolase [Elstera litoralis]